VAIVATLLHYHHLSKVGKLKTRSGSLFRRCPSCRWQKAVQPRKPIDKCGKCGSRESLSWGFQCDLTAPGAKERKRTIRSGFTSRKEAESELRRILRQQDIGSYASAGRTLSFGELAEDWLLHLEDRVADQTLRVRTFESYRSHISAHVAHHPIASVPVTQLDRNHIRNLYRELRDGGMSPTTVHRVHATIRGCLNWAVNEDVIPTNPAQGAHRAPRGSQSTPDPWTEDELSSFLSHPAVADDELRALWHVAAMTGMRRSEVLGLRWSDVDPERRTLRVAGTVIRSKDRGLLWSAGSKNWEARTVTIPDSVVAELEQHRRLQQRHRQWVARDRWQDHDLVFPAEDGTLRDPDSVTRRFARLVKRSGARPVRLHDLRHAHASHLIARGATPVLIQRRLGHKDVTITLGIYGHVFNNDEIAAVDELAVAIAGGG
jgi:integrase